jgi:hypothetical protein
MKKLSSVKFTWENHGLNQGENGWRLLHPDLTALPCEGYQVVGYCDGSGLQVRPQDGSAVMFLREEDSVEFWLHVSEYGFEKLNKMPVGSTNETH